LTDAARKATIGAGSRSNRPLTPAATVRTSRSKEETRDLRALLTLFPGNPTNKPERSQTMDNQQAGQKSPILKAAWNRYHTSLEEMRIEIESSPLFDLTENQRGRAYHQLMEVQAMAYNFAIAPRMLHPRLFGNISWQSDVYCSGGNSADFSYKTVFLDGQQTYRLKVKMNDSPMLLAQHNSALPGVDGSRMLANYEITDFDVKPNGTAEIILSADEQKGNWIKLDRDAGYQWLLFRPVVSDWDKKGADLEIERISEIPAGHYDADDFDEAGVARRIGLATDFLRYMVKSWMLAFHPWIMKKSGEVNKFAIMGGEESGEVGSPSALYIFAPYDLKDDEALIMDMKDPPNGPYWSVQLFDIWLRTIDFRTHQTALSMDRLAKDSDGGVRLVISRRDPGVANWLETAGFAQGQILLRAYLTRNAKVPTAKVVKVQDVLSHLPASTKRISAEDRAADMVARRKAYQRRYGE
jgi:hypothetical protein